MRPVLRASAAAAAFALAALPARAEPKDVSAEVVLLAPADGPGAVTGAEFDLGLRAGLGATAALRREPLPADPVKLAQAITAVVKSDAAALLVWAPDGAVAAVQGAAEKAKLPLIVLSPEAPRPTAAHATFHAGGVLVCDEALQAMDFLLLPVGSRKPAILTDGSERAADVASRCLRIHHFVQEPLAPAPLADPFDAAAAQAVTASGADGIVYFGGAAGAERLLAGAGAAGLKLPILLGQGLVTAAVPTFAEGRAKTARALDAEWFEDYGGPASDARDALGPAAQAAGTRVFASTVRGYRTGQWVAEALRAAGGPDAKKFVPALRHVGRAGARGKKVFDEFGRGLLCRLGPWESAAAKDEPACRRLRHTLVPMQALPQIGTFRPSQFEWQEGTLHVQCTWGAKADRTIEKDLGVLGLSTGGYEAELEARILDDLMGRFISRMNRLFLRNPDGTAVPGVSWKISFATSPPPKGAKGVKFTAVLAGDDPAAGGRASGSLAMIFTTFIQRTIYAPQALKPVVSASDRKYLTGQYRWGTSVAENLRCDTVRSLLDGYSQGLALTGAHEIGHLCGPDHDTESPRSIMNVVEAVGLDFDWAEWIPAHARMLDKFLGREPAARE